MRSACAGKTERLSWNWLPRTAGVAAQSDEPGSAQLNQRHLSTRACPTRDDRHLTGPPPFLSKAHVERAFWVGSTMSREVAGRGRSGQRWGFPSVVYPHARVRDHKPTVE